MKLPCNENHKVEHEKKCHNEEKLIIFDDLQELSTSNLKKSSYLSTNLLVHYAVIGAEREDECYATAYCDVLTFLFNLMLVKIACTRHVLLNMAPKANVKPIVNTHNRA